MLLFYGYGIARWRRWRRELSAKAYGDEKDDATPAGGIFCVFDPVQLPDSEHLLEAGAGLGRAFDLFVPICGVGAAAVGAVLSDGAACQVSGLGMYEL